MKNIRIKNGQVYQEGEFIKKDLLISEGKIIRIGNGFPYKKDEIIDASGLHILPGAIDPHVHMHLPTPAGFSADDFKTGSRAALAGGTTSLIDFVTPKRGQSIIEALYLRRQEAENSLCDVKFHVSPVEWNTRTESELIHCIREEGIRSFKVYMAYQSSIGLKDEDIFKVMKVVGKHGGMITMHCEMDDEIEAKRKQLIAAGKTNPLYHPISRPNQVEAEAVKRAIQLAKKAECPLYIVHVSTHEALEHIANVQAKGQLVYAETCPQYLLLNNELYDQEFDKSCKYVMSPPLRKKEDGDALWQAIADGVIQSIGTDHCPFTLEQKRKGISDFTKIPNGAGGVEHRLSLLYTYGVLQNRITLKRFMEVTAENPAQIFGMPNKGTIEEGMDADLCLWDLGEASTISAKTHHQHCDLNIYEGFEIIGKPRMTMVKGEIKWETS